MVSSIKSYRRCRSSAHLTYEDLAELIARAKEQNLFGGIDQMVCKSSGTTNAKSKFIPVSNEALNECHFKAGKDMLSLYFNNNSTPNS